MCFRQMWDAINVINLQVLGSWHVRYRVEEIVDGMLIRRQHSNGRAPR